MLILFKGNILESGPTKEVFSNIELIRKANLRLPRITHLCEILEKKDGVDFNGDYPLTIGEARRRFNVLIKD